MVYYKRNRNTHISFSALQRAEIAEIVVGARVWGCVRIRFSALQRAEIAEIYPRQTARTRIAAVSVLFNEPKLLKCSQRSAANPAPRVSVLFNEPKLLKWMRPRCWTTGHTIVSVLFNEPKLLKFRSAAVRGGDRVSGFSALQRAEIAEIHERPAVIVSAIWFQCSSTSRNC